MKLSWSEEAEQATLGACMLSGNSALAALDLLTPEDFAKPAHQHIFAAIRTVVLRDGAADPITVGAALGNKVEECGGRAYIHSLASLCPAATRIREYAQEVYSLSVERKLAKAVDEVMAGPERGTERLAALAERLYSIDARVPVDVDMQQALEDVIRESETQQDAVCHYPWVQIEHWTRGLRPGNLVYLAGQTSHGKTAAALQIAEHNIRKDRLVLFNSLEMSPKELAMRMAMHHGANTERIWFGQSGEEDREIVQAIAEDPAWRLLRIVRADSIPALTQAVRRYRPSLVIVDYLGLMVNQRAESRRVAFTETSSQLKSLAVRMEIPILCLAQLSRGARDERNRIPTLDRLKESGDLENDADAVVMVWRKRDETGVFTSEAAIVVAKCRNGHTGALRMSFDGRRQEFVVVADGPFA